MEIFLLRWQTNWECQTNQSGELSPVDNETDELQYFNPINMPELALPYPKSLFTQTGNNELYFQWNENWLKELSKN